MERSETFGGFVHDCRKSLGMALREFCRANGLDAGNFSKLERGKLPPPASRSKLEEYAHALRLEEGSDDWYRFFDLAAAEKGRIPDSLMADEKMVSSLPLVFRTLRGQKLDAETLDKLVEKIRKE